MKSIVVLGCLLTWVMSGVLAAPVDANSATQADLEQIPGVGPSIAQRILDERGRAPFKDWRDLIGRVKGIGSGSAAKFSDAGLTVDGATFDRAAAVPAKYARRRARLQLDTPRPVNRPMLAASPSGEDHA